MHLRLASRYALPTQPQIHELRRLENLSTSITWLSSASRTTTQTSPDGPSLPVTGNVSANDVLPEIFQIKVTANNSNAGTYSVGYVLS